MTRLDPLHGHALRVQRWHKASCTLCIVGAAVTVTHAGESTWLGGNGNWFETMKWSAGVPGATDVAVVGNNTLTVTLDADAAIAGLQQTGGTISGLAALSISGPSVWNGGYQDGSGWTTFLGSLALEGANGGTMTGGRTVVMHDTAWTGNTSNNTGTIYLGGASMIRNMDYFVENQNADHLLTGSGGVFDNLGHFVKQSATLTDVTGGIAFHNRGSVTVEAGRLLLRGGGNHSGRFQIDSGALLDLNFGTHTMTDVEVTGAGTLQLSSGTMTFLGNDGRQATRFVQAGGTVAGGNVVFEGPATWLTGRQSGSGATVFADMVELSGLNSKIIENGRSVTASQTAWSAGHLQFLGSGGSFVNAGQFDDLHAGTLEINGGGLFTNGGVYRKQGPGTTIVTSGVTLDNIGALSVEAGTMVIDSPFTNVGAIGVAAGANLRIRHPNSASFGSVFGNGVITGFGGNTFVSRGTISPGMSTGTLTIDAKVELAETSLLEIELTALDDFDRLVTTSTLLLGGELAVHARGYTPGVGDNVVFLTFGERLADSTFASLTSHGFGHGVEFELLYGSRDVTLRVAAVPEPSAWLSLLVGLAVLGTDAMRRRHRWRAQLARRELTLAIGRTAPLSVPPETGGPSTVLALHRWT